MYAVIRLKLTISGNQQPIVINESVNDIELRISTVSVKCQYNHLFHLMKTICTFSGVSIVLSGRNILHAVLKIVQLVQIT